MTLNLWLASLFALCLPGAAQWNVNCPTQGQIRCRTQFRADYEKSGPNTHYNSGWCPRCGGNAEATCMDCPAGTFAMANGTFDQRCAPCPPGRYGNIPGAWGVVEGCPQFCPTGKYVKQKITSLFHEKTKRYLVPGDDAMLKAAWSSGTFPTTDVLCKDTCTDVLNLQRDGPRCGKTEECELDSTPSGYAGRAGETEIALLISNGGKLCFVCEDGFHQSCSGHGNCGGGPTLSSAPPPTCREHTPCSPGLAIDVKGTNSSDQTCKRCPMGHFNGYFNADSCKEWATCNATVEQMVAQGTSVSNTVCIPSPLKGATGPQGAQGSPGINGTDGTQGAQGSPGANGFNGTAGVCPSNCRSLQQHGGNPGAEDANQWFQSFEGVPTWVYLLLVPCGLIVCLFMCKRLNDQGKEIANLQHEVRNLKTRNEREEKNRNTWDMRSIEQDRGDGRGIELQTNPLSR